MKHLERAALPAPVCGLDICVPPNSYPQGGGVKRWGLWEAIRLLGAGSALPCGEDAGGRCRLQLESVFGQT